MLYVTTRNKFDTYTVHRANQSDRGPDEGLYLPFRLPTLEREQLLSLRKDSFCQRMASILNLLCGCQLTAWDVELCSGKNPAQLVPMSHRILIAEVWHNHDLDFAQLESRLAGRICGYEDVSKKPTSWIGIAVRMAMLFAVYGEILSAEALPADGLFDVTVVAGDFATPMAVWYAREMGLPVGNIVCNHDDSCVWDLLHQGQIRTDNGVPENLERLISATLGVEENLRFCECVEKGRPYTTIPGTLELLRQGMYAAVTSQERLAALIPSVYRTAGYVMGEETAMAYGGLQDYRAKMGENRLALLWSGRSPIKDVTELSRIMNMTETQLRSIIGA